MLSFILADLRRLWAGSLVVVLLIAMATALGVTVTLQERALRLGSARAAEQFDLVVGAAGSETQLVLSSVFLQPAPLPLMPAEVLTQLQHDPRVAWAAPVGFGDFHLDFPIVGTTRELLTLGGQRVPREGRWFAGLNEAVVGATSPLALGEHVVPMHGRSNQGGHEHAGTQYVVVGRLPATGTAWDKAILVPIEAVWRVHGMSPPDHDDEGHEGHEGHEVEAAHAHTAPGLPAIVVKPRSITDAYRLRGAYRANGTVGVFPGEVLTQLYGVLGDARAVLAWLALGAQALVAAAIVLVTVVHVAQRRRQIGALRAFGAPRLAVFGLVWGEMLALVLTGLALGHAIGFSAAKALSRLFAGSFGMALPVGFVTEDAWSGLLLLTGAALVCAIPALLAYRQSPASALRA